ncbi:MAG: hypothetical protein GF381_03880 [Candidatus Pacebacteria bacterium]|nr:hypothetical protein [Candidatus Paceibacterota bacterium]
MQLRELEAEVSSISEISSIVRVVRAASRLAQMYEDGIISPEDYARQAYYLLLNYSQVGTLPIEVTGLA